VAAIDLRLDVLDLMDIIFTSNFSWCYLHNRMYVNTVYHQSLAVIWVTHAAATDLSIILGLVVYLTVVWVRHAAADHPSIYLKIICGSNVLICYT